MATPLTDALRLGRLTKGPTRSPKPDPKLRPPKLPPRPGSKQPINVDEPGGRVPEALVPRTRPGGPPRGIRGDPHGELTAPLYPPGTIQNFKAVDPFKRRPAPPSRVARALARRI